jgi:hypothetical protein
VTDRTIAIAETPEALTPQWLTDALCIAGVLEGAVVTDARVTPVGTGQMCDSARLACTTPTSTSTRPASCC